MSGVRSARPQLSANKFFVMTLLPPEKLTGMVTWSRLHGMRSSRVPLAAIWLALCCGLNTSCDSPQTSQSASVATPSSSATPFTPPVPAENWSYTEDKDEMTGKKILWACTSAPEGARLCLRKKGLQLESYISFNSVSDGQFLCLHDDCMTKARFDEGPVVRYEGTEAAGGTTTMLFIEPTSRLISQLRKSKSVKLQPPSGLKW